MRARRSNSRPTRVRRSSRAPDGSRWRFVHCCTRRPSCDDCPGACACSPCCRTAPGEYRPVPGEACVSSKRTTDGLCSSSRSFHRATRSSSCGLPRSARPRGPIIVDARKPPRSLLEKGHVVGAPRRSSLLRSASLTRRRDPSDRISCSIRICALSSTKRSFMSDRIAEKPSRISCRSCTNCDSRFVTRSGRSRRCCI